MPYARLNDFAALLISLPGVRVHALRTLMLLCRTGYAALAVATVHAMMGLHTREEVCRSTSRAPQMAFKVLD